MSEKSTTQKDDSSSTSAARRVYLDNAATSWPKCSAAVDAAQRFVLDCGATTGRGAYSSALEAERQVESARRSLSRLIGASRPSQVAFCTSGTHALNVLLGGLLRSGDHLITTAMEHNSVLRPLHELSVNSNVHYSVLPVNERGLADPRGVAAVRTEQSKYLLVGHASNVTGHMHDLAAWSRTAQELGLELIVDTSQTLGYQQIAFDAWNLAALASAGHKGLGALPGTGFVAVRESLIDEVQPIVSGGTGVASERVDDRPEWPLSVEVGNLNTMGVVSMGAAAGQLLSSEFPGTWRSSFERLYRGLLTIPGLSVVGGMDAMGEVGLLAAEGLGQRVPVVSISVAGWAPYDLATVLDGEFGIEVRAGYHCAALVHEKLGTQNEGTLRLSTGHHTTHDEVDYVLSAFQSILSA